ncbi:MAG TPA: RecX family transcriptional regulator [Candidatus Saccharimonadales bacterium]|nr:RecX family transcriptional regulator [Candidatus Saccharimonadales bacterium]
MTITAIKQQVKRHDRYSVFVDGKYALSLSEGGLIDSRLVGGQEISPAQLAQLKQAAGLDKAYGNALRYVAMRPRSEGELREYFRRKQVDGAAANDIIARLRGLGLLDDASFARAWVENRRLLKHTSKRRLAQELRQKHVPDDVIRAALEDDEADDRAQLRALVVKKRARYPDAQKLMQYLARQGFGFDDIKAVLAESTDP